MSETRYSGTLPGDNIPGPFLICLVVGREGVKDPFVSLTEADDLLGVRQFLYDALSSRSLYESVRDTSTTGGE